METIIKLFLGKLRQRLEQLEENARASEVTGTLAITFICNEPDLKIEVAARSGLKVVEAFSAPLIESRKVVVAGNIRNASSFVKGERKE